MKARKLIVGLLGFISFGFSAFTITSCSEINSDSNNFSESSITSSSEFDADNYSEGLELTLSSDKKSYSVTGIGKVKDTNIVIPAVYKNKPVTSIAESAFENNRTLISVTMPDSIIEIGDYAFYNCHKLSKLIISDDVEFIGTYSFYNCTELTDVSMPITALSYIPKDNIKTISITSGESIEPDAFSNCNSLETIIISENVKSIGKGAFSNCNSLISIEIPSLSGYLGYIFGATNYNENRSFVPSSLKEVKITNAVEIYEYTFYNCNSLTRITIPNSVTNIGKSAFSGCDFLNEVYYRGTIEKWLNIRFENSFANPMCYGKILYMLDNNNEVYEVTSVTIPNTITSIGDYVFYNCKKIKKVYYTGTIEEWCNINFNSSPMTYGADLFLLDKNNEWYKLTSLTIPNSIASIDSNTFAGCSSLTSVTIGNSVKSIGNSAFSGCSSLTSVTIPDSVTSIGSSAFSGCNKLTSITIPNSVTSIGSSAFSGCNKLTSVTIPDSVTSIGDDAFSGCSSLTSITMPTIAIPKVSKTNLKTVIITSGNSIPASAFSGCNKLTSITIPNSVKSIGGSAFSDCSSLTSITIPDSVTSISEYAFSGCSSLTSITIPDSVTSIGKGTFHNCSSLTSITIPFVGLTLPDEYSYDDDYHNSRFGIIFAPHDTYNTNFLNDYVPSSLKKVIITNTTRIGSFAFDNCKSLESITLPDYLTSIGYHVFENCISLRYIDVGEKNNYYKSIDGNLYSKNGERLIQYAIGKHDTSFNIPNGVTTICDYAFESSSLTSIKIPYSVTSIEDYAFQYCKSLVSIEIPNSVTSIGDYAFYYCYSLKNVYYKGSRWEWDDIYINDGNSYLTNATIHYNYRG